ncbi:MAG: DM13 domain-containing protein [Chitinophagaceae bacterium]|jgi:hypothetical protein
MRLLFFILLITTFISCKKETLAPTNMVNEMVDSTAVLKYAGNFSSGPYGTVSGKAEIYKQVNQLSVKLSGFLSSNGPALHVYLSKEAMPINFIDLGVLKSTNGNQVYNISGTPDFTDYKYISIHCIDYNHLFGYALLN